MPFYEAGFIKYYKFISLDNQGLYHAIFTRRGGFSPDPWHSLNFGASVGDDLDRVMQNKHHAFEAIHINPATIFDLYQVHSTKVVMTDRPLPPGEPHQKADAIITQQIGVSLLMRFADCVPVLLFDPVHRAIGIFHAGWIGTVDQIARKTILAMKDGFGTNPGDVMAAIGPSIGPDHYSIGEEVIEWIHTSFGERGDQFICTLQNQAYFDLWSANEFILRDAGVEKIEVSAICTCCNLDDWYSHRGEHGKTGRFGVVFGLVE